MKNNSFYQNTKVTQCFQPINLYICVYLTEREGDQSYDCGQLLCNSGAIFFILFLSLPFYLSPSLTFHYIFNFPFSLFLSLFHNAFQNHCIYSLIIILADCFVDKESILMLNLLSVSLLWMFYDQTWRLMYIGELVLVCKLDNSIYDFKLIIFII